MAERSAGRLRTALAQISPGEEVAATGGLILFAALFLKWYSVSSTISVNGVDIHLDKAGQAISGWHALSEGRWLFLGCSLLAILIALARAYGRELNLPLRNGFVLLMLGGVSTIWIALRIVSHPADHLSLRYGCFVGLAGATLLSLGALRVMSEASPDFSDYREHPAAGA